ncbi:MAG: hypothetical protein SFW35_08495 [Chitinophagales bacterium]|nr:hypothetical protein [Chitinophagales bacterium]
MTLWKSENINFSFFASLVIALTGYAIAYFERIDIIVINHKEKVIEITIRRFFKQRILKLSLKETIITYKDEIGPRGSIGPMMKIYRSNQLLLKIIPGLSGWSDQTLKEIVTQIQMGKAELS